MAKQGPKPPEGMAFGDMSEPPTVGGMVRHSIKCTAPGCGQRVSVSASEPLEMPRVGMHRRRSPAGDGAMCGAVGQPICPGRCGITEAERHPRRANEWRCVNCKLSWPPVPEPELLAVQPVTLGQSPRPNPFADEAPALADQGPATVYVDVRPSRAPYDFGAKVVFEGELWELGVNCKLHEKPQDQRDEFELIPIGSPERLTMRASRWALDRKARRATAWEIDNRRALTIGQVQPVGVGQQLGEAVESAQAIRQLVRSSPVIGYDAEADPGNAPGELRAHAAKLRTEGAALLAKADRLDAAAKLVEQAERMINE